MQLYIRAGFNDINLSPYLILSNVCVDDGNDLWRISEVCCVVLMISVSGQWVRLTDIFVECGNGDEVCVWKVKLMIEYVLNVVLVTGVSVRDGAPQYIGLPGPFTFLNTITSICIISFTS